MKRTFNEELDDSFDELNQTIHMKPETHDQLRNRILEECIQNKATQKQNRKLWISIAAALFFLVASSPFYSTTMASLAAKILPLEIPVNATFSNSMHAKLLKIIEQSGYEVSSVGSTPNPFTIRVVLVKGEESLSSIKEALEPPIKQLLYDEGIDQYEIDISLMTFDEKDYARFGKNHELMNEASTIIRHVLESYGYAELAQNFTYGLSGDTVLELDMPDHVEEAVAIQYTVMEEIQKKELAITNVKLRLYNEKHRNQDNRWSFHVTTIYEALAGKSRYNVTGVSYKVKKGVTSIWIKTALPGNADKQVLADIEEALHTYLANPEVMDSIQDDAYIIQLESKDNKVLLEISSDKK